MGITINSDQQRELVRAAEKVAKENNWNAEDIVTIMSFETAGKLDPWTEGPTTKWGTHRGLIQWGGPQAEKYGVDKATSITKQVEAAANFMKDHGVKPGDGILSMYASINAGDATKINAKDAAAGGTWGTVKDKVESQMDAHRVSAKGLIGKWGEAFRSQLGAYHENPIDGLITSPYDFGTIATPTKNPGKPVTGITGEDAALPPTVNETPLDMSSIPGISGNFTVPGFVQGPKPVQAPSIMPAQESIAQNWGSYRTPDNQSAVTKADFDRAKESIYGGLPDYTPPSGQRAYAPTVGDMHPSIVSSQPTGLMADIARSVPSLATRQSTQPSFSMEGKGVTGAGASFTTSASTHQPSFTKQESDLAAQYGMYQNPNAKAYYDPIDASIPSVIGPNLQQSASLLDPGVPVEDGPPKGQVFDDETGLRSKLPGKTKQALQKDRVQQSVALTPEKRGIIQSITNPAKGFLGSLLGNVGNVGGIFSGRESIDAGQLAGIVSNAINATGRGDLTTGRGIRTSSSGLGTSVTSGPSKNFDGYDAATNNFGVTTVSNDNMSFIDNSDGGAAGGNKVLCTHYHSIGWLSDEVYAADSLCGLAMPVGVVASYHWWAKPLVKQIKKRKWLELVLWPPVKLWAHSMHWRFRELSHG